MIAVGAIADRPSLPFGGEDRPQTIVIYDGDVPTIVAEKFCKSNRIRDVAAAAKIASAIVRKAEILGSGDNRSGTTQNQRFAGAAAIGTSAVDLFSINVNIKGKDEPVVLTVRHGDIPSRVAEQFSEEHRLDPSAKETILNAIIDRAKEIQEQQSTKFPANNSSAHTTP